MPDVRAFARTCLVKGLWVAAKERKKGADGEGKYRVYHAFEAGFHSVRPHQASPGPPRPHGV